VRKDNSPYCSPKRGANYLKINLAKCDEAKVEKRDRNLVKQEIITPTERIMRTEGNENEDPKAGKEEKEKQVAKSASVTVEKASPLGPET
jgi:hypothetical protein